MKNLCNIILFLSFIINCSAQNNDMNFVGNWSSTDYFNTKNDLILTKDNYITITINGETIDGKNFIIKGGEKNGQKAELKYSINTEKNPIEIDLIAIKDNEEKGRILGSIKPIDENSFLLMFSFGKNRIIDFSEINKENFLLIERKK